MLATPGLADYLDKLVARYESPAFINADPISVPLAFDDPRDQEIIGLYAALLAWGRRETILKKMAELCARMEYRPHRFVRGFDPARSRALEGFGHRTFRPDDAVSLTAALSVLLDRFGSIEGAFQAGMDDEDQDVGPAIQHFSTAVMQARPDTPPRLQKHLARPAAGSACKRLCMYLRWMVRTGPVDLGIWTGLRASQLVLPLDVHSGRQARALGLLSRPSNDWKAAMELTATCRALDPDDPCRYDFAFFGPGAFADPLDPRFVVE
ncbi:MAG: TIGR02757 family protein [Rhodothermales bacterium]|nr:TIGR02757 family protein [Rhodothermales bacterium]